MKGGMANISTSAGSSKMAINLMAPLSADITVPVNVTLPLAGAATLTFTGADGFAPDAPIYLEDKLTGITIEVTATSPVSFTSATATVNGRFRLVFVDGGVTAIAALKASASLSVSPTPPIAKT